MSEANHRNGDHAGAAGGAGPSPGGATSATYPLFLRLRGRRVLVVGAGEVAAAKLAALHDAGAELTVVAPEISPAILALAEAGALTLHVRPVEGRDLDAAWLVIAAAPPAVNRVVHAWGEARKTFVLAVDDVASTDAFSPAVFARGDVRIALSSEGRAPALVGLLREALEHALPDADELAAWLRLAVAQRAAWKRDGVPLAARRSQLLRLLVEERPGSEANLPDRRALREPNDTGGPVGTTERPGSEANLPDRRALREPNDTGGPVGTTERP